MLMSNATKHCDNEGYDIMSTYMVSIVLASKKKKNGGKHVHIYGEHCAFLQLKNGGQAEVGLELD